MRCQPCERGRVKCSLTEGTAMTLRESMGLQRPAKKTATSMTWMYHPTRLVGGDDESEVEENNPPDDVEELSTPPKTVEAIRVALDGSTRNLTAPHRHLRRHQPLPASGWHGGDGATRPSRGVVSEGAGKYDHDGF